MQGMDERRGSGFGGLFDTRQLTLSSAWLWIRTWNGRGRGRRRAERLVAGCARLGYSARQDASPPPSASAPTRRAPGPAALACIRLRAPSVSVRSLVVHSGLPHRPSPASIAGSRSPRRRGRRRRRRRRRRQRRHQKLAATQNYFCFFLLSSRSVASEPRLLAQRFFHAISSNYLLHPSLSSQHQPAPEFL